MITSKILLVTSDTSWQWTTDTLPDDIKKALEDIVWLKMGYGKIEDISVKNIASLKTFQRIAESAVSLNPATHFALHAVNAISNTSNTEKRINSVTSESIKNNMNGLTSLLYNMILSDTLPDMRLIKINSPEMSKMNFYGGVPNANTAYIAHPGEPNLCIPLSQYNQWELEHKKSEFVRICASLGARSIKLIQLDNSSTIDSSNVSLSKGLPDKEKITASQSQSKETTSTFDMSVDFFKPTTHPCLPNNLYWFHREPMWQAMAYACRMNWLQSYKITFSHSCTSTLAGNIGVAIKGMGFGTGGEKSQQFNLTQTYEVTFFEPSKFKGIGNK